MQHFEAKKMTCRYSFHQMGKRKSLEGRYM